MFRRFSNRQLSIVLAALALLYLVSWVFDQKGTASFTKELVLLDTAEVDNIKIFLPEEKGTLTLTKTGQDWQIASEEGAGFRAASAQVNTALASLQNLSATQLVSTRSSAWGEFGVNDSAGVRVQVGGSGKILADIWLGRFQYQQTGMTTYARPEEEDNTYLVEGYVRSGFEKEIADWRDKTLIQGPNSNWLSLNFTYPADSSFQIIRSLNNQWVLPDSTSLNVTKVNRYLNRISSMKGTEFVDAPGIPASFTLQINTATDPLQVQAYTVNDSTVILGSSLNPDAYFNGNTLWEDIFVGLSSFMDTE